MMYLALFYLAATINVDEAHVIRLVLPLPSTGAVSFVLQPLETLGQLLTAIRDEDDTISTLAFYYQDGKRVAHTTTIEDLTKSTLRIQINEKAYDVQVPDVAAVHTIELENDVLTVDDVDGLVERAYFYKLRQRCESDPRKFVQVEEFYRWASEYGIARSSAHKLLNALHTAAIVQHFESNAALSQYIFLKPDELLHTVSQSLGLKMLSKGDGTNLAALARVEEQIKGLDAEKFKYDSVARKHANRAMFALFAYLLVQFGVLADMVWIDFNWDIMEPITYFVTLTTLIGGFSFFIRSKSDYTYPALAQRLANSKIRKLYIANRFNYQAWNTLDQERTNLLAKLGSHAPNK